MTLSDENASVMDGLGETDVEDLGLETTGQEVLDLQAEHVIELHLGLVQDTDAHETSQKGVALEESLGVLLVQREEITSGLSDLGQRVVHSPHFVFVSETELADELQLMVQTLFLVRSTRRRVGFVVDERYTTHSGLANRLSRTIKSD